MWTQPNDNDGQVHSLYVAEAGKKGLISWHSFGMN